MTHPHYISTFVGLGSCVLLGLIAFWVSRLQKNERTLTEVTERRLQQVSREEGPALRDTKDHLRSLPIRDQLSLYSNSRLHLLRAHRLCLEDRSGELQAWMERAEHTHTRLLQALALSVCETIVSYVLRPSGHVYSDAALWLYLDEEWILTEMTQRRLEILEGTGGL